LFICLMSCWWLDSMFFIFSPVGARRDFCIFLFNVVLVARLVYGPAPVDHSSS
jgi:hypothetical protein